MWNGILEKLCLCVCVIIYYYNVYWVFNDYIICCIIMFLYVCDNGLFVVIFY